MKNKVGNWLGAFTSVTAPPILAILSLRLRVTDMRLVWLPNSDLVSNYVQGLGYAEGGSRWSYPRIGSPGVSDVGLGLGPQFDWLNSLVARVSVWLTNSPVIGINVSILLSFGLIGLVTFALCRTVTIPPLASTLLSVMFSCLPFHFIRMQHHLVASYWWTSLLVLLVVLVARATDRVRRQDIALLVLLPIAISGSSAYGNVYGLAIFCLATFVAFIFSPQRRYILLRGVIASVAWIFGLGVQVLQFLRLRDSVEGSAFIPNRAGGDAVLYSQRLFDFFFPSPTLNFSSPVLSWLRSRIATYPAQNLCPPGTFTPYQQNFVCDSSVEGGSFGTLLTGLFLIIALILLFRQQRERDTSRGALTACSVVMFLAIIVSTTNGAGAVFQGLIPSLRKPGVIAPLVIVASLVVTAVSAYTAQRVVWRRLVLIALSVSIVLEVLPVRYDFVAESRNHQTDLRSYIQFVEEALPANCSVYRLSTSGMQETMGTVSPYQLLAAIYSRRLNWIYTDSLSTEVNLSDTANVVDWGIELARYRGACAVDYVRPNYSDPSVTESEFRESLKTVGSPAVMVDNPEEGRYAFQFTSMLRNSAPRVILNSGVGAREPAGNSVWRWTQDRVEGVFVASVQSCYALSFVWQIPENPLRVSIFIDGALVHVSGEPGEVSVPLRITPGVHRIVLAFEGKSTLLSDGRSVWAYLTEPKLIAKQIGGCA